MAVRRDGGQSGSRRRYVGIPSPAAAEKSGSQKAINRGTRRRSAPQPQVSPPPSTQLRDSGELDRKGRQKTLVKQKPRKKSKRGIIVPKAGGGAKVISRRQARKIRREARKSIARNRILGRTKYGDDRISARNPDARDPDTKILGVNVEAQVEGRGALQDVAKFVRKRSSDPRTQTAGFDPGRIGAEATDLAANAPSGLYLTGRAVKKAAKDGDTEELDKLWKDYKDTSAVSALVSGDAKEAGKRALERPLTTALEVSGGKALAGRGAGAAMRKAPSKTLRKAASTKRAPIKLYAGEHSERGPKIAREYSKDVITKGVQVAKEKRARKRGRDPDVDTGDFDVAGVNVARPSVPGSARGPRRARLERLLDARVFSGERVRKERVKRAARESSELAPHPSKTRFPMAQRKGRVKRQESPLVHLVAEGTVLTRASARADLTRRLRHLESRQKAAVDRGGAFERGNLAELNTIREVMKLDDKAFDRVFASAFEYANQQGRRRGRQVAAGARAPDEDFARFTPVLQGHMGAKYDRKAQPTPAYQQFRSLREQERKAYNDLRRARQKLETSKRHEAKAQGKAEAQKRSGTRLFHGTDAETAKAVRAAGNFVGRRRDVVWAGDKATAKRYGNELLEVTVTPKRPLDVHSERYATITHGKQTASDIEAAVRQAGHDALISKRDGWVKAFDKSIVRVDGRAAKVRESRAKAEAAHAEAKAAAQAATKARKEASVPKDQRRERGWRLPDGRLATRADVEAFLRDPKTGGGRRDPESVAFVTQMPVRLTARGTAPEAFMPAMRGQGAVAPFHTGKRKGTAYDLGREDVGAEALTRQALIEESEATAGETFQLLAEEFGVPAGKDGRFFADSYRGAEENLAPFNEKLPVGHKLVPVNIDGMKAYGPKLQQIQENIKPGDLDKAEANALADALTEALSGTAESGKGRWVGMPQDVVQRLRDHADVRTTDFAGVTNLFKDVVLTTASPTTWLTGNVSDIGFRMIMEGITPADIIRGRKIVRQAETKGLQGEQASAALTGGGFFHSSSAMERFRPTRINEHTARTVGAAPWRAWKGSVYQLEHAIEALPQVGRVGKAARRGEIGGKLSRTDRDMQQGLRRLLYAADDQVDTFATRLATDRALEAKIQLLTEDVIGRWGKISPKMRKHLGLAPFIQWLGASMRYTLVTLPAKHPIKTGILAGIMEMTEEERMRLGLSYMIPQDQRAQGYQMGTLPMSVAKNKFGGLDVAGFRTSNLTSFGTVGGFPENVPGFILPQLRGAFSALGFGVGFTGEQMVYPDWWPDKDVRGLPLSREERTKVALGSLLEVAVPFAGAFRRAVQEKGRSALPQSTILDPQTRKKWDNEHKAWRESEGSLFGGISEWINPLSKNKLITHGSVRDIKKSKQRGEVFGEMRDQADAEVRKAGGAPAVKVNARMREIREAKDAIIAKHPNVDSDNPTPEYARLHREYRRLDEKLHKLTKGKKGHKYVEPYQPSGGGSSNPYADDSNPYADSGGENPYGSTDGRASPGENPYR